MNTTTTTRVATLAAASLLAAGATAFAAENGKMEESKFDIARIAKAKIDLVHAIDAATTSVGGAVVDAGLWEEGGKTGWEIELAQNDGTTKTVVVDMTIGNVDTSPKLETDDAEKSGQAEAEASESHEDGENAD